MPTDSPGQVVKLKQQQPYQSAPVLPLQADVEERLLSVTRNSQGSLQLRFVSIEEGAVVAECAPAGPAAAAGTRI